MDDGSGIQDLYVTLLACVASLPPYPLPPTPFDACYAGYDFACVCLKPFYPCQYIVIRVNEIVIRFHKIVRIERLLVWAAILVSYVRKERASGAQCPIGSFDTHPRWRPVTQSARSRESYGEIGDCEQSIIKLIEQ